MKSSVLQIVSLLLFTLLLGQSTDAAASLSFTPNRASAERMKQLFLARVSRQNAQAAQVIARALADKDVSFLFEQAAAPYGLHDGNLADAVAAREIMKRMRETGSPAPSPAEVSDQRERAARAFAGQSGPRSEASRREFAEIAQIGFVLDYLAWSQGRSTQPSEPGITGQAAPASDKQPAPDAALEQAGAFIAPIGAATQSSGNFTPTGSTIHLEAWYLYPNGIATDCSAHDPETLQISLVALRSMRDCTGARWRRVGGKVQIQVSDRDPWNNALEQPAQPRGTRIQFLGETAGGAGTMPGAAGVSVNTVDSGRILLTGDGHIRAVLSSATTIGGTGIGGGASAARRIDGTYSIDGFVMTITAPNGQVFHRLTTVVHEGGKVYVYFQGREYWPPSR